MKFLVWRDFQINQFSDSNYGILARSFLLIFEVIAVKSDKFTQSGNTEEQQYLFTSPTLYSFFHAVTGFIEVYI